MIGRIGRLLRVELMKLAAHPFLPASLGLLLLATVAAALTARGASTEWRHPHAIEMFAAGAKWGLRLSGFVLVIFGSMLFAGEFDRGTIKILLTRPVTRTDLFAAKCLTGVLLAAVLTGAVLAAAWGTGCAVGDLGPVWDPEHYVSSISYEKLLDHLGRALWTGLPAVVASCFVGLLISNLVESSGYAVAIALVLYIAVDAMTTVMPSLAPHWAVSYPGYAFDTLRDFARGSATLWKSELHRWGRPVTVPLATVLASAAVGYAVFTRRNITV